MIKHFLIWLAFSCTLCCNAPKSNSHMLTKDIVGCWNLKGDGISYRFLHFKPDSTVLFTSAADTIYRYKYWISDQILFLKDNEQVFRCPIISYKDSIFSFKDVIVNRKVLIYSRALCGAGNGTNVSLRPSASC